MAPSSSVLQNFPFFEHIGFTAFSLVPWYATAHSFGLLWQSIQSSLSYSPNTFNPKPIQLLSGGWYSIPALLLPFFAHLLGDWFPLLSNISKVNLHAPIIFFWYILNISGWESIKFSIFSLILIFVLTESIISLKGNVLKTTSNTILPFLIFVINILSSGIFNSEEKIFFHFEMNWFFSMLSYNILFIFVFSSSFRCTSYFDWFINPLDKNWLFIIFSLSFEFLLSIATFIPIFSKDSPNFPKTYIWLLVSFCFNASFISKKFSGFFLSSSSISFSIKNPNCTICSWALSNVGLSFGDLISSNISVLSSSKLISFNFISFTIIVGSLMDNCWFRVNSGFNNLLVKERNLKLYS